MNDAPNWMIYGATGYTGELIARHAVAGGQRPLLAGRSPQSLALLASELGCPMQVFSLDEPREVVGQLSGVSAVLNCAGPFSRTARPMMDGCLKAGVDYLDITGEIGVIEAAAERNEQALRAGVTLMPAVGFDVVPTDCLAAMLAERLPGAQRLELAFAFEGGMSRGTAKTMLETIPEGGRVRIAGRIERVPAAWKAMLVPFRDRSRFGMTIPWGDVASAYYTTGIPNIEVYMAAPRGQIRLIQTFRWLFKGLKWKRLANFVERQIDRGAPGPDAKSRERERSSLWGRASAPDGSHVSATLETLSGYQLTMLTAVEAVARVRCGVPKGFMTPARALGSKFILEFPQTDIRFETDMAAATARS